MKPELMVRRLVHSLGYRFRLHRRDLPGNPDLAFIGRRKTIFVHGCFWHQHPDAGCRIAHKPRSNLEYWQPKLDRTIRRDATNLEHLKELGWEVLVVWECQTKNAEGLQRRLRQFLER